MKRNAKTVIAGVIALAMSQAAMAEDIKVAVVGAMSGPVAQWGDMEFIVPLFYADKCAFFCLSMVKSRILSVLNRLKNRGFTLYLRKILR